jgi:hypothetical protein
MMSILRSTLVCSVVQWTMSVKLVNLATEREREVVRISQKEEDIVCLLESRVLAEVSCPSFGVHLICMNISIRTRGGGIFQLLLKSKSNLMPTFLESESKLMAIKVGVRLLSFLRSNMHNIISHS